MEARADGGLAPGRPELLALLAEGAVAPPLEGCTGASPVGGGGRGGGAAAMPAAAGGGGGALEPPPRLLWALWGVAGPYVVLPAKCAEV